MGNKGAKLSPRTIEELQRHLGADLSDEEIKIWYNDYQESLTPGKNQLTRKDFTEVYDKLFSGDAKEFAEHVFRTFDADGNGSVDFQEFAVGLFVSSCQDLDKKLDWAFRVYDINGDGYITKDEMAKIVTSICKMTKSTADVENMIHDIFNTMDVNKDQRISREEFLKGASHNDFVIKLLQPDPDS
ncbi:neurocalcin homolog [Crassostrea angulata]|uniref:Sulfhydryl light chain n=3 Tax=Magallana gigas TaxID=29159 RepID=K1PT39_MAGGI|nr:neurocalcin homolog [Crassostrea gigas]XP_052687747.1 neurocalcin homolog [Crassostrea angulata]|eukprot:XP_011437085.1 PREDICTED: neurocalcin homolog [Crassostrea gigas]